MSMSYSFKRLTTILLITLLTLFTVDCGGKKKKALFPFWIAALMGGDAGTGSTGVNGVSTANTDSNGVVLPSGNGSNPNAPIVQEIATHGPATISGNINPQNCKDSSNNPIACSNDSGLDLSQISVQLVDSDGNVVATTQSDANGNYTFNIDDLNNGNYRVLINTGNGLNSDHEDINFTFNPTVTGPNLVSVGELNPDRLYITQGPAVITGQVTTPGFKDQTGSTIVNAGGISGATVNLVDSSGNVIGTTTTDSNGNYSFNIPNLTNGNYTINILGSGVTDSGQPFSDVTTGFQFSFVGNDPNVATNVNAGNISSSWNPATSAVANISSSIQNVAINGSDLSGFTVNLKDASGNIVATTTTNGNGEYSFSQTLTSGVYSIEVIKDGFLTANSSFSFTPNPSGTATSVSQGVINVVPRPSNITGTVSGPGNSPSRIEGAVINFRPSNVQPPTSLLYLIQGPDDRLRNLATLWLSEACPTCYATCASGGFQASCVAANQGSGPWSYSTYANKVYEVKPDGTTVFFTAVAGKWDYFVSAPGYQNSSVNSIVLNGQDYNAAPIILQPSLHRTQIAGQTAVLDTLSNGTRNGYPAGVSGYNNLGYGAQGLFAVMLGNTDNSGNAVAHVAVTNASGAYAYNGTSKVVTLPALSTLCNSAALIQAAYPGTTLTSLSDSTSPRCSDAGDSLRVAYAISQYATAKFLSDTSNGVTSNDPNASVCSGSNCAGAAADNGYQFRGASYNIIVVDPLKHMSASSTRADNSGVTLGGTLTVTNTVLHLPRRTVQGTITDAITTGALSGATVEIGVDTDSDPNTITFGEVRRDQATIPNSPRINYSTGTRNDEVVPSVVTDANGNYSITNLDPGNYVLRVTKDGYVTQLISVTVPSTGPATVSNIQIVKDGPRGNVAGRVVLAGGAPFTETYSLELVHPTAGTRPTAPIQPSSLTSGTTIFSNAPSYNIFQVNPGQWKIKFASPGYVPVEGIVTIQGNATTNFDIVTMIPGTQVPAPISGRLINAFTNVAISSGLTVTLRPGINNTSGPLAVDANGNTISSVTSSSDGSYVIPNVPAGNYTVEVSGNGFATTYQTVISAGANSANQNIFVSPTLGADEVRIVLSWGNKPKDLDSHLEYGDSDCRDGGYRCQVVWNQKSKIGGDLTLDVDDVDGYGPETVTVKGSTWSKPRRGYSVFNYNTINSSDPGSISTSGGVVKVFKSTGLVRTYVAGPGQVNAWWQIFCLDGSKNLIDVGQPGCSASDFFNRHTN
ncbi:MAG: carboxypeptidase regulatory-like domain-containing protein [Leptospiraceae bacterium]|nr:carboxypeptidase regulatory-like domain-containing protein [Leptospiraceae bacterium]